MSSHANTLKVGAAVRRITPPIGTPMGGFGFRDHGCEGVRDDLFARAIRLESQTGALLVITLDLAAVDLPRIARWKDGIRKRWGLNEEEILINLSHTHSGPLAVERFYQKMPPDQAYLELLESRIFEAVAEASHMEEGCSLKFGRTEFQLGISRRHPCADGVEWKPYLAGYAERDLPVLQVNDARGEPIVVIFSASAHPSILADYLISSEYPGVACRVVEREIGGRVVAMFLQGAAGELKVNTNAEVNRGAWRKPAYATVKRAGETLAGAVIHVLDEWMEDARPVLTARQSLASLPLSLPEDPSEHAAFYAQYDRDDIPFAQGWVAHHVRLLERGEHIPQKVDLPVHALRITESMDVIAVAGELTSGLAQSIRRGIDDGQSPILLGYSNGILSYLPSDAMLPEGGYEAFRSVFLSTSLPAPYAPGIDAALVSAVRDLLQQLDAAEIAS